MKLSEVSKKYQVSFFVATILFRQETFYREFESPNITESRVHAAIGIINGMRSMFLTILEAFDMHRSFWETEDAETYIKNTDIFFTTCTNVLQNLND